MNKIEFGKFIYNRRKKLNLSQQSLANELCLSSQAISNWERGISYPEISYLDDLSKILKISINDLFLMKDEITEDVDKENIFNVEKLANALAVLRKMNNMSQADLATKLGIQYQTISSWERGISLPSIEQLIELSNIYNVSLDNLYYGIISVVKEEKIEEVKKKKFSPLILITFSVIILGIFIIGYFSHTEENKGFKINFEGFEDVNITNNRITKFPDASKEGYIFLGWYYNDQLITEDTVITSDMVLTPRYKTQNITITFMVDDKIYKQIDVEYGSDYSDFPDVPKKKLYNGYWDTVEIKNITDDITIKAIYKINVYQVVILDDDGNVISIQTVEHGKTIENVQAPEKEGYTFIGWSEDLSIITKNVQCKALYERNSYLITIVNEGSVIKTEKALYDSEYVLPNLIKKGYTFDGYKYKEQLYNGKIKVTDNMTLEATYTKLPVHNIIFKDEKGNLIKRIEAYETEEFLRFDDYITNEKIFGGWVYKDEYISFPFVYNFNTDIELYASFLETSDIYIVSSLNENEIAIVGMNDDLNVKRIIIPDMIDNKKVVRVTENVFKNNEIIEYVQFGKYVKKIENKCFENCINLKEVYFNNDIEVYGLGIFDGCKNIKTVHINGNYLDRVVYNLFDISECKVYDIYINEDTMFEDTSALNSNNYPPEFGVAINLYLPSTLTMIKGYTFKDQTFINDIYISSTTLTIESYAFYGFQASIIFLNKLDNLVICDNAFVDTILYNGLYINSTNVTISLNAFFYYSTIDITCDNIVFSEPTHTLESICIHLIIRTKEIEKIPAFIFTNKNTIIEIYGTVKEIEAYAFYEYQKIIFHTKQDETLWEENWCMDKSKVEYDY